LATSRFITATKTLLLWWLVARTPERIIKEGEMFLLPPRVPHSPRRPANTVGLVLERHRRPGEKDGFHWYCENCNNLLHEEYFELKDIVTQLPAVMQHFYSSEALRTCKNCMHVMEPPK
jgi:3-hydroxyanthranilate 3,4-dioxygenase